jgi:CRISPR-associated protein Cmr4
MQAKLMFVHALSPIHAGTGQSLGAIDLAIARDRATDIPYIPGSSIKGTLRDTMRQNDADSWGVEEGKRKFKGDGKAVVAIFGPETANASDHAGSLVVGDANLLLLPVRSVAGTFAWVTSPFILSRFLRDAQEAGVKNPGLNRGENLGLTECYISKAESALKVKVGNDHKVVFEDLDLTPSATDAAGAWADFLGGLIFPGDDNGFWRGLLKQKLCIVHDDMMTFFAKHAVDVSARIRMNPESGTVDKGGLWYEENLPTETILSALLVAAPPAKANTDAASVFKKLNELTARSIQLGGNATVGRGRCRVVLSGGKA